MLIKLTNICLNFVIMKIAADANGGPCSPGLHICKPNPANCLPIIVVQMFDLVFTSS